MKAQVGDSTARLEYTIGFVQGAVDFELGGIWTFGRSARCTLVLRNEPRLSGVALWLKRTERSVLVLVAQGGLGLLRVHNSATRASYQLGESDDPIPLGRGVGSLELGIPGSIFSALLSIPEIPATRGPRLNTEASGLTHTWTSAGGLAGQEAGWIDVIALACAIAQHPLLTPRDGRGRQVSKTEALRRACEVWCNRSSLAWMNERLHEAADAAGLTFGKHGSGTETLVRHYSQHFPAEKLRRLADRVSPLIHRVNSVEAETNEAP